MAKKYFIFLVLSCALMAQTPDIKLSGFVDAFYSYDTNTPQSAKRQEFLFNHNRHNEFNVNLALAKIALDEESYRANEAFQGGTYAEDNYPSKYKNIHEANAGLALSSDKTLWLDAGIFTSHLGFESAISMDNYTLTRSLAAENSPYYLTGTKLTYAPNAQWEFAAVISNGWQVIERDANNSMLSFGTQVLYKPNTKTTLNWSTFAGSDDPDTHRRMRYFNNFFGEFLVSEQLRFIAGFDVGALQKHKGSSSYDIWYIPSLLAKYSFNKEYAMGGRLEYVDDRDGAVIAGNGFGAKSFGASTNLDYTPQTNLALRAEVRWLEDANPAYKENHSQSLFFTGSLALKF